MKYYLLLVGAVVLASCETFNPLRGPASISGKHYIISMHGISGTPASFHDLLPILEEHLTLVNPNFSVETKEFQYSSGEKGADIERFVSEFENFLVKEIPVLNEGDKISLIAHSQGGQVGHIWYLKALDGVDLKQRAYMERIDGFVTLGTPFWGSRTTYMIKKFIPNSDLQDFIFEKLNYGDQEILDITAGSEKIYGYFSKMAKKTSVNVYYDPRMLNLAAVVPAVKGTELPKNKFLKFFYEMKTKVVKIFDYRLNVGRRWESDQAVGVSSARLGFYYYSDEITRYMEQPKRNDLRPVDFDYSRFFKTDPKYVMVEGVHAKASGYPHGYAIASVPPECGKADECEHTSYYYIFQHLANCENPKNNCRLDKYTELSQKLQFKRTKLSHETNQMLRSEMRTYNLALDLVLPKNFIPPKDILDDKTIMKYLQVDYVFGNDNKKHLDDKKNDGLVKSHIPANYQIRIGRLHEWGSRIVSYSAEKNKLQIQLTGSIQPKDEKAAFDVNKKYPLQMILNVPGLKKRKLIIPLQPTYTTFLDLQLD